MMVSSLSLSASDPEQQQASVTDGRVLGPAVGDLRVSGLQQVERPGPADLRMNERTFRSPHEATSDPGRFFNEHSTRCGRRRNVFFEAFSLL